ncbi:hypothetical protein [Paenibacillus assamensis]|uniref:hypothetical protein n=1 Tax=Paenibacillus assamensis TaxID=311244 RepID=UPI000403F117|nr:hypothetical protein [Paenibacillus assamensis]
MIQRILPTIFFLVLIVTTISACGNKPSTRPYEEQQFYNGMFDLAIHYQALEELAYDAELIVEAELTNETEQTNVSGTRFTFTDVKINKVIEGNPQLVNQTIQVLDLGTFRAEPHKKNVLFLVKYDEPVDGEAYALVGYYQGRFKINDDNKVVYDADKYGGVKYFQGELEGLSIEAFDLRIQEAVKNAREPMWNKPQLSEEERKLAEEESRKLYLEDRKRIEEEEKFE